jgi:hypothetical protein
VAFVGALELRSPPLHLRVKFALVFVPNLDVFR